LDIQYQKLIKKLFRVIRILGNDWGREGGVSDFVTLFIKVFKFFGAQKWSFLALRNIRTTHYEIKITVTYAGA